MKLGITNASFFTLRNTKDGFLKMKSYGYDCVDYNMSNTEGELYALSQTDFEEVLLQIKSNAEYAGIEISQVHGPWRWPPQDFEEEDRAERFEKMSKCLCATAILGCKYMVIHPIMPYGISKISEDLEKKTVDMNFEFFSRLTEVARQHGVVICFENMPMPEFILGNSSQIFDFVKKINSENFRVCLDVGHANVCGEKIGDTVRMLGTEYLKTLHVHDNNGIFDLHLFPFMGSVNWQEFAQGLQDIGFDGTLSLETFVKAYKTLPADITDEQNKLLASYAVRLAENKL